MKDNRHLRPEEEFDSTSQSKGTQALVLFNDDEHDFNFVIESLIEICDHSSVQAEQCTYLAHYKGKCVVKEGVYEDLKLMKDALIERGLHIEIK